MDNFRGSRGSSHEAQGWLGQSGCCWDWVGTVGIDASQMLFLAQRGLAFRSSVVYFMLTPSVWSLTGVGLLWGLCSLGFGLCFRLRQDNGFLQLFTVNFRVNPVGKERHLIFPFGFWEFWKGGTPVSIVFPIRLPQLSALPSFTPTSWPGRIPP